MLKTPDESDLSLFNPKCACGPYKLDRMWVKPEWYGTVYIYNSSCGNHASFLIVDGLNQSKLADLLADYTQKTEKYKCRSL